jgi:hypothetical protein
MTAIAADTETLRELEAGTRRAWSLYHQRSRQLSGDEYERVEHESWAELQNELGRLEDRRRSLVESPA